MTLASADKSKQSRAERWKRHNAFGSRLESNCKVHKCNEGMRNHTCSNRFGTELMLNELWLKSYIRCKFKKFKHGN